LDPPIYLRPEANNFPLLDALLVTKNRVFLLQATIARTHSLKPSGIECVKKVLPESYHPNVKAWNFVWVVNSEEEGQKLVARKAELINCVPEIQEVYYHVCQPIRSDLQKSLEELLATMEKAKDLEADSIDESKGSFEMTVD